jgi:hypothetical protein
MRSKSLASIAATSLLLIVSACGGGGGGTASSASFTGKFIDAAVSGMAYRCGTSTTTSGSTTATGEYTCATGQAVAFYVGDILIGSVSAATAVVTPMDLVGNAAGPSTPTVMNIVRFLMSISSTDPTTGVLTIDPAAAAAAVGKTADFSTGGTALDGLITTVRPSARIYTTAEASTHMTSSVRGLFAGTYAGTYAGGSSGSWRLTIASDGSVSGTSDAGAVTGTMATTLSTGATSTYGFNGSAGGTPWTGGLNVSTKVFSGNWNTGAGSSGTFTGTAAATPAISSFSPTTGSSGTAVTLTGTNLAAVSQVLFTGPSPSTAFAEGVIATKTATSIATTVPNSLAAGSYTISLVFTGGEAAATSAFTIPPAGR